MPGRDLKPVLVVIRVDDDNICMLFHLGTASQASSDTGTKDTSSEDSRSVVMLQAKPGEQRDRSAGGKKGADSAFVDLKMELALEMSKFIEDIEYQLEHVVPMADLCLVGDVGCSVSRLSCCVVTTCCC